MSVKKLPATPPTVEMGAALGQSWLVSHDTVDMTRRAPAVRPLAILAEPQNIVVDANKCALLIVDMQNDFCTAGGWLDSRGIDISPNRKPIEPIRKLVAAFHRDKLPIVWVNWGVRRTSSTFTRRCATRIARAATNPVSPSRSRAPARR
jgi:ureidoacrylate peracid hydrolase